MCDWLRDLEFGDDPDHDANTGIFRQIFTIAKWDQFNEG